MSTTRAWFCEWCVNSYIHSSTQLFPNFVPNSLVFCRSLDRLHRVVSMVCAHRLFSSAHLNDLFFTIAQKVITSNLSLYSPMSLAVRSYLCWKNQIPKADHILRYYFTAVIYLHVAYKTTQGSLTDDMLDILATPCLQSNDARRCLNARHSSELSLSQAAMLMKVVANNSRSTVQLTDIELAHSLDS